MTTDDDRNFFVETVNARTQELRIGPFCGVRVQQVLNGRYSMPPAKQREAFTRLAAMTVCISSQPAHASDKTWSDTSGIARDMLVAAALGASAL